MKPPSPAPSPTVLTRGVRYQPDCGRLLEHLATASLLATTTDPVTGRRRPVDTVLLESVDTATKVSRTTIAVLEASARLTCEGESVLVEALPQARADGEAALARLRTVLGEHVRAEADHRLTLTIPPVDGARLEERERLSALSTVEPLRVLAGAEVDHPHLPLEAGVVAFDYLATFEALPEVAPGANTCPDYLFYDARILLVIDHPTREASLVGASVDGEDLASRMEALARAINATDTADATDTTAPVHGATVGGTTVPGGGPRPGATRTRRPVVHAAPTQSDAGFAAQVERLKESIAAGEVYQVVPSRDFTMPCPNALAAYHELRLANPSPYMFYVAAPGFELLGASPESALLHSARTGTVSIRPIAGTRPRGLAPDGSVDHELDTRLELELRTDAKEVAEHVMLVDLARNDVARVSVPGTRRVHDLLRVDRYSRVMHLVSEVSGTLAPGLDALDALRASMTMGTLTGAPKLRAAELIRLTEGVRRGSYGGSVGYLRGDGELDTCIVIRSAFVRHGRALVQAGAGVVSASVAAAEAAETVHKASAVLHAVAAAQGADLIIDTDTPKEA
ncbi:anthranilate synthase component 1 [Actinomyces sp. W5033]|uniref:anthranilate synthase component 1 n=1 Tax=Actinomyces sp. W5033 TaxID=3446479 RepID=UPI003EE308AE